jgi:sialic acid synthase SpsE
MSIQIENKTIGTDQPVFIIAEIGVNHEGDFETCKKMVEESARAGADAIKLQTVDADENYVEGTFSWTLFRTCALNKEETAEIFRITRELGMVPFTTSPDVHTLKWVNDDCNSPVHKISSGMMTNDIIIRETAKMGRPVLISTGLGTTEQIDHAVKVARDAGCLDNLALFQCTSQYPVEHDKINLATMKWMADRYGVMTGFSDHTKGIEAPMVATTLGAVMIEKHVTLTPGRLVEIGGQMMDFDHHIGLDFGEFAAMVEGVRRAENMTFDQICEEIPTAKAMVGEGERFVPEEIQKQAAGMSRCLVARQSIKAGDILTTDNIGLKRPFPDSRGMEPFMYDQVLGMTASSDMDVDTPVKENDVEGLEQSAA